MSSRTAGLWVGVLASGTGAGREGADISEVLEGAADSETVGAGAAGMASVGQAGGHTGGKIGPNCFPN